MRVNIGLNPLYLGERHEVDFEKTSLEVIVFLFVFLGGGGGETCQTKGNKHDNTKSNLQLGRQCSKIRRNEK